MARPTKNFKATYVGPTQFRVFEERQKASGVPTASLPKPTVAFPDSGLSKFFRERRPEGQEAAARNGFNNHWYDTKYILFPVVPNIFLLNNYINLFSDERSLEEKGQGGQGRVSSRNEKGGI